MPDAVLCPQCGVNLTPKDPNGLYITAEHAEGCTAVEDARRELKEKGLFGHYPEDDDGVA